MSNLRFAWLAMPPTLAPGAAERHPAQVWAGPMRGTGDLGGYRPGGGALRMLRGRGCSGRVVGYAQATYGALHLAVNNAGIGGAAAPAGETDVAEWQRVIGINLNGVLYGMRHQIPSMLKTGARDCAIVNMASIHCRLIESLANERIEPKHSRTSRDHNTKRPNLTVRPRPLSPQRLSAASTYAPAVTRSRGPGPESMWLPAEPAGPSATLPVTRRQHA